MATMIPIRQIKDQSEAELLRQGWRKQTTIGEPRLSEVVESYRALGYEVHVQEFRSEGDGCTSCFDVGQEMGQSYGTVYLRKRDGAAADDELF